MVSSHPCTSSKCCINAGPASQTPAQYEFIIGSWFLLKNGGRAAGRVTGKYRAVFLRRWRRRGLIYREASEIGVDPNTISLLRTEKSIHNYWWSSRNPELDPVQSPRLPPPHTHTHTHTHTEVYPGIFCTIPGYNLEYTLGYSSGASRVYPTSNKKLSPMF